MRTLDILAAVLVLGGSTLALTAAIGAVRFPDTLTRMHAATKPQVLGLLLVLIGAAIRLRGNADVGVPIERGQRVDITIRAQSLVVPAFVDPGVCGDIFAPGVFPGQPLYCDSRCDPRKKHDADAEGW